MIILISSCQSQQEEFHPLCASEFCSASGMNELQQLLDLTTDSSTLVFRVQLIDAANSKKNYQKYLSIEDELNFSFKGAKIKFKVNKEIKSISNKENIDTIFNDNATKNKILEKYNISNSINIYIVPAGKKLNGYTHVLTENFDSYPTSIYNYLFINEKAIFNGNTIQHEIGHFFGLQHTFGKSPLESSTDEKPDGSNCSEAGDFICDTPADPNGKIGKNCAFLGLSNGKPYPVTPDISNFMSYYPPRCKMNFTTMQCKLIHNFGNLYRTYLTIEK